MSVVVRRRHCLPQRAPSRLEAQAHVQARGVAVQDDLADLRADLLRWGWRARVREHVESPVIVVGGLAYEGTA